MQPIRVELHVFVHQGGPEAVLEALFTLTRKVDAMAAELDRLTTEVSETNGAIDSAIVLIKGFSQALKDAIASGNPQALKNLADSLDSKQTELAQAVADNPLPTPPTP
jgi:hypothetical protein